MAFQANTHTLSSKLLCRQHNGFPILPRWDEPWTEELLWKLRAAKQFREAVTGVMSCDYVMTAHSRSIRIISNHSDSETSD